MRNLNINRQNRFFRTLVYTLSLWAQAAAAALSQSHSGLVMLFMITANDNIRFCQFSGAAVHARGSIYEACIRRFPSRRTCLSN